MGECYVGQNLISAEGFRVRHFGVTHDGVEPVAGDADNIDFFQPLDIGVAFTALTNVVKDKLGTAHTTAVEFRLRKCWLFSEIRKMNFCVNQRFTLLKLAKCKLRVSRNNNNGRKYLDKMLVSRITRQNSRCPLYILKKSEPSKNYSVIFVERSGYGKLNYNGEKDRQNDWQQT